MHLSRTAPTHLVVRNTDRHSDAVYRMVKEFRSDATEISGGATAHNSVIVFYISPVPLILRTRLGERKRNCLLRIGTPTTLMDEVGRENVPEEVRNAFICVALQPITAKQLHEATTRSRMMDALREACREVRKRAQRVAEQEARAKASARRSRKAASQMSASA